MNVVRHPVAHFYEQFSSFPDNMLQTVTRIADIPIANEAPLRLVVDCGEAGQIRARICDPGKETSVPCLLRNFRTSVDPACLPLLQSNFCNFWAQKSRDSIEVTLFPRLRGGGCGSSSSSSATPPQPTAAGRTQPTVLPTSQPTGPVTSQPSVISMPPPLPRPPIFTQPAAALTVQQMQAYKIESVDYFSEYMPGNTTILNNHVAALKRCMELTKGVGVFEDPDFGPKKAGGATSIYYSGSPPNPNYPEISTIKWQRPSELLKNTCFFSNEISSNDSVQGNLGDCWFIGAISVIATRDELVRGSIEMLDNPNKITAETATGLKEGVYPPLFHPFAKKGLYCFSFFKNAKWRYVIIDDKLPFQRDNPTPTFIFAHCRESRELWVSLIEKAYAKLHTCYEALVSGLVNDGLVDMTGYACDSFKLQGKGSELFGPEEQKEQLANAFWDKLNMVTSSGSLLGCSIDTGGTEESVMIDQHASGLLSGHAYSISKLLYVDHPEAQKPKKRHRLLVLRNPWGEAQYNGKWGQRSQELSDNLQLINKTITASLEVQERFDPTDTTTGDFLMCFKDWRTIYTNLYACIDFPSSWTGIRFKGSWTASTAGGLPMGGPDSLKSWAKNPQYVIDLKTPAEMFFMLFQEDGRLVPNLPYPFTGFIKPICLSLLRLQPSEDGLSEFNASRLIKNAPVRDYRDTNIDKATYQPGKYLIVPSTKDPGQTGTYYLSVYHSCPKAAMQIQQRGTNYLGDPILEEEETSAKASPSQVQSLQQLVSHLLSL